MMNGKLVTELNQAIFGYQGPQRIFIGALSEIRMRAEDRIIIV